MPLVFILRDNDDPHRDNVADLQTVSEEKMGAAMEHITMRATTTFSGSETKSKFKKLWIGQEEVAVDDRSIAQCLEEMYRQGWILTISRAKANLDGILCEYEFQRPIEKLEWVVIDEVTSHP